MKEDNIHILMEDEGLRTFPYKCSSGKNTIGYGHNLDAKPLSLDMQEELDNNDELSIRTCNELLLEDIHDAEMDARELFPLFESFTDNRKDALVMLCFNLGLSGFGKFIRTIKSIQNSEWDAAGRHLRDSKWALQVGKRRSERIIKMIVEG